ncbi:MAG: GTPase Era [Deltaproteobacteria bacterium]|nr:GTPase Era [Deltaproteobacteria bacterium]
MDLHRAGTVALVGRPNAGKSTLLNQILGVKVAAVADKPQTTRNRIAGIHSAPGFQAILVDTPGLHPPHSLLNQVMVRTARKAIEECDVVCWIVDGEVAVGARSVPSEAEAFVGTNVLTPGHRLVVTLNKVDTCARELLLPVIAAFHAYTGGADVVPVSALTGENVDRLLSVLGALLPEGPALWPEDQVVEASERFVVGEMIREKLVRATHDELPYATAVEVEAFDESEREGDRALVRIHARIVVERASQKAIVIGRGGAMIKRVGSEARRDIEALLGCHVHLALFVAIEPDWTQSPRRLRAFGYG